MTVPVVIASVPMLCRANLGILNQKLLLMDVMRTTFGAARSREMYQQVCPIVQATIGQHIRHSMDHIELAAQVAAADAAGSREIHYDIRRRGGPDEYDMDEARIRIQRAVDTLTDLSASSENSLENFHEVQACFMLSSDPQEFQLPSTVQRELGFAAHHGIHHMAMVKIIATETLRILPEALPPDFGRAPSTVVYHKQHESSLH